MNTTEIINLLCEKFGIAVNNAEEIYQILSEELITGKITMLTKAIWIFSIALILFICLTIYFSAYTYSDAGIAFGVLGAICFVLLINAIVQKIQWTNMPTILAMKTIIDIVK